MSTLTFPHSSRPPLTPYLPPSPSPSPSPSSPTSLLPHITLTYATSLDSTLSLSPGTQTHLSGPASKAMTHYLRSRHSAILIGVGTALADDPALNCRLEDVGVWEQPRPVIVDPRRRWRVSGEERVLRNGGRERERGRGIVVVCGKGEKSKSQGADEVFEKFGGEVWECEVGGEGRMEWEEIFRMIKGRGIGSVMVEGGGTVINELLREENLWLVTSVIVTLAPVYLGRGGVVVSPQERRDGEGKRVPAVRLGDVKWLPMGEDVVMCGKPQRLD
ncbi:MAG: 2,5-diamino-6-(ribosylamino)-4(3H)-pyrimidinone 5'-phosphate reductase [Candelina submexicana]|nr:MAG: 2,5-diamino-6-(ribosylamino)-4(3H)-pyrimidinone 5'-phosphate reductase [Candelina submexicana]